MYPRYVSFRPSSSHFVANNGWSGNFLEGCKGIKDATLEMKGAEGTPYCLCFGENGTWLRVYKDGRNKSHYKEHKDLKSSCPTLSIWLKGLRDTDWDAEHTSIALGPKGSFFAWSHTKGGKYYNIPAKLDSRLKKPWSGTPRVSLGAAGTYFFWTDRGDHDYRLLGPAFQWMNGRLTVGVKIQTASLSAFQDGVYFILLSDGASTWKVPEDILNKVQGMVNNFRTEKKNGGSAGAGSPKLVAGGMPRM